ncbi:MAG: cryptochrome/photolyase family protein, partial [Hyphomicrobium sp.]
MPPSRTPAASPALIPILGDQLSLNLTSLRAGDKARDVVVMAEVAEEATYVRHHKKKIAFLFAAMRHFAAELEADGWTVRYVRLDDRKNGGSFTSEVARIARETKARSIVVTEPGEWRVRELIDTWETETGLPVTVLPDERFICARHEFGAWAHGRKSLRMEFFYREMRRKTGLLMAGEEPEGGKWNFDADNRKPAKADLFIPKPLRFAPDAITREVLDLVAKRFANHFGDLEPFWFAVTRADAEKQLKHFLKTGLAQVGDYQDAMLLSEPFLYHSILSL